MSEPTLKELLAMADRMRAETPPPGWFTRRDVERERGVRTAQATKIIRSLAERGLIESRKFCIHSVDGTVRYTPHYKFMNGKHNGAFSPSLPARPRKGGARVVREPRRT